MDYDPTILPLEGESDADAVARLHADPARYQAVPSKYLGAWAALGGRLYKLEQFVAAPNGGNPQMIGMQSAVKMTLQLLANPQTEIFVHPGHPHRQMLDGLVAAQVLTADDVSELVEWYGRKLPAVTQSQVAAARAAHVRRTDAQALADWANAQYQAMLARIGETGTLPTRAELAAIVEANVE